MVERPASTTGTNFSIQWAMWLGSGRENRAIYLVLMRNMHDLTLQAGLNWELVWAKIPTGVKEKLVTVNRHRHAYKMGWLEPPPQYTYLKTNSAKRDQSAPHGRRARSGDQDCVAAACISKKVAGKQKVVAKRSGKKRAHVVDDKDDEMSNGEGPSPLDTDDEEQ
ncbi:hypothetical protein C8R43DRAFT_1131884 [Mycena crocata]|nr:hypothetical protein C8R43DRAFT_1131884 [Mycena crocata]